MSDERLRINGRWYALGDALALSDLEREVRAREDDLRRAWAGAKGRRGVRNIAQATDLLAIARERRAAALDAYALPQADE